MLADYLSDRQIQEARERWSGKGETLGQIAAALGNDSRGEKVGIYHLSPWLYADDVREELEGLDGD